MKNSEIIKEMVDNIDSKSEAIDTITDYGWQLGGCANSANDIICANHVVDGLVTKFDITKKEYQKAYEQGLREGEEFNEAMNNNHDETN